VHVGYRGWERSGAVPAAPFGHGLGWTTWSYDDVTPLDSLDGVTQFAVKVTNTGSREGAEVVQAYVASNAPLPSGVDRPVRWLAGFARVTAAPGETATATIRVDRRTLEVWHAGAWLLPAGDYRFEFGRSIRDQRLTIDRQISPYPGEGNGSARGVSQPN
jgi:beta-glucosidase